MSNWKKNRELARTFNTSPSLADQAGAKDTDINIIVKQFLIHGQAPGGKRQPQFGVDLTNAPTSLREMFELADKMKDSRKALPPQLAAYTDEQLFALTQDQLTHILTPPATKPEEEKK